MRPQGTARRETQDKRSICEPSHSQHPHATHRANAAAAVGAGKSVSGPPPTRPTRQSCVVCSFSSTLTRKHHCFRPLRACSLPRRNSEVTSQAVCVGKTSKKRLASYVGLCNVYWPRSSTQTHQLEHIASPCREQTPNNNHTRLNVGYDLLYGHTNPHSTTHAYKRQAQAPRKKRHARCTFSYVPRTTDAI